MPEKILVEGTYHYNENEQLHCDNGPAIIYSDGSKEWYKNGLLHREDGPAVEYTNGNKHWYKNGLRHREDSVKNVLKDLVLTECMEFFRDELDFHPESKRLKERYLILRNRCAEALNNPSMADTGDLKILAKKLSIDTVSHYGA